MSSRPSRTRATIAGSAPVRRRSSSSATPMAAGARATATVAISASGSDPPPARAISSTQTTSAESPSTSRMRVASASARARTSATGVVSIRSVGISRSARVSSRQANSVASRAASVILSRRSARAIGCFFRRAITSCRPQIKPGLRTAEQLVARRGHDRRTCGDALGDRGLLGQPERPQVEEHTRALVLHDRDARAGAPSATRSARGTSSVNPTTR